MHDQGRYKLQITCMGHLMTKTSAWKQLSVLDEWTKCDTSWSTQCCTGKELVLSFGVKNVTHQTIT